MNTFMTATDARLGARNNILIHTEVREIENLILQAVNLGELSVNVIDTTMTDTALGQTYFRVWRGLAQDRTLEDQMNQVIQYFTSLGYGVARRQNTSTNNTFIWEIVW